MNFKEYPKSRICTINFNDIVMGAIKQTYQFCETHHISFTTNGNQVGDIRKLFFGYCLDGALNEFNTCPSRFPKILIVNTREWNQSKYRAVKSFIENNIPKILGALPLPCCKVSTTNDKDIEAAAVITLERNQKDYRKLVTFAQKQQLNSIVKKYSKLAGITSTELLVPETKQEPIKDVKVDKKLKEVIIDNN